MLKINTDNEAAVMSISGILLLFYLTLSELWGWRTVGDSSERSPDDADTRLGQN